MEAFIEPGELAGADGGGELAGHVYAVDVYDAEGAVGQLAVQGDDRDDGYGVAAADEGLDGLGAAELDDHIEVLDADTAPAQRPFDNLPRTGASVLSIISRVPEPFSLSTSGSPLSSSGVTDSSVPYLP